MAFDVVHFWETMNLLVEKDWNKRKVREDVEDWIEKVVAERKNCKPPVGENHGEPSDDDDSAKGSFDGWGKWRSVDSAGAAGGGDCVGDVDKNVDNIIPPDLPKVECSFLISYVRTRLEKLMGSNLVSLTDRAYMKKLQERILEDYGESMDKRIAQRETDEMERVKDLVLHGLISMDDAPPEMADHPVMLIEMYCRKLIAERRAKLNVPKIHIPRYVYIDDSPDPASGLTIEDGHKFREKNDRLCIPPDTHLAFSDQEDVINGFMLTEEDITRLKYESPLIKELMNVNTVEELYQLADEIIGEIKSLES